MKLARPLSRTPALVVVLVASAASLGISGCGDTRACKSGTLFVSVDFVGAALDADKLNVDVKPEGDPIRTDTFDHAAGSAEGSVEIDFPSGYQVGNHVLIVFTARKAGAPVAIGDRIGGAVGGLQHAQRPAGRRRPRRGPSMHRPTAGRKGGRDGADGGSGTGGTGARAAPRTAGVGGGSGTGGAIDAGPDTGPPDTGCVFQSAEDCFNGIDDDCNGHVDCDDPACGASTTCVPAAGDERLRPRRLGRSGGAPVRCASTAGESTINSTLDPGVGCTGCSCDAPISCAANLYKYALAHRLHTRPDHERRHAGGRHQRRRSRAAPPRRPPAAWPASSPRPPRRASAPTSPPTAPARRTARPSRRRRPGGRRASSAAPAASAAVARRATSACPAWRPITA